MNQTNEIFIQAHRGAPGVYRENTIPSFLFCCEKKVDAIEMDVVVSRDMQLVVAHDPYIDHSLHSQLEKRLNLFKLNYDIIKRYEFPSLKGSNFNYRPLLQEVIQELLSFCQLNQLAVPQFTIEIKSDPELYGSHYPYPSTYAKLIHQFLEKCPDFPIRIQSFDLEILRELKSKGYIDLIYLIEDKVSIEELHETYMNEGIHCFGIYFKSIDQELVQWARSNTIELSAWTVNEWSDFKRLISMGIENIITDRAITFRQKLDTKAL